jgi:hypothetical protein
MERVQSDLYTATDWVYDGRTVKRWNVDPKFKSIPNWSPYVCLGDNPIFMMDPTGDLWRVNDDGYGNKIVRWVTPQQIYGIDAEGNMDPKLQNVNRENVYTMYAEQMYDAYMNVTGIRVYNEDGTQTTYKANEYGLVQIQNGQNNIENYSPNDIETEEGDMFMNTSAAVALYNTIGSFRMNYPTAKVEVGDGSTKKGNSPRITDGSAQRHGTHYRGNAVDIRYMDSRGNAIKINLTPEKFNKVVSNRFMKNAAKNGLTQQYVGTNDVFKGMNGVATVGHNDHMHVGTKPVSTSPGGIKPMPNNPKYSNVPSKDI